jgi:hypothetical protein
MIAVIPLTVIPLILYNGIGFAFGGNPWPTEVLGLTMVSGQPWSLSIGDLIIVAAIVCLFFEMLRAARYSRTTIYNHITSTLVLVVYLVEFIIVGAAATSVFLILSVIALFDVIAGFSISIRTASRDIAVGPHAMDGPA